MPDLLCIAWGGHLPATVIPDLILSSPSRLRSGIKSPMSATKNTRADIFMYYKYALWMPTIVGFMYDSALYLLLFAVIRLDFKCEYCRNFFFFLITIGLTFYFGKFQTYVKVE